MLLLIDNERVNERVGEVDDSAIGESQRPLENSELFSAGSSSRVEMHDRLGLGALDGEGEVDLADQRPDGAADPGVGAGKPDARAQLLVGQGRLSQRVHAGRDLGRGHLFIVEGKGQRHSHDGDKEPEPGPSAHLVAGDVGQLRIDGDGRIGHLFGREGLERVTLVPSQVTVFRQQLFVVLLGVCGFLVEEQTAGCGQGSGGGDRERSQQRRQQSSLGTQ